MGVSVARSRPAQVRAHPAHLPAHHLMPTVVGEVNHVKNGFNPTDILTDFDSGQASTLPSGQTLREYTLIGQNATIEVVPGLTFEDVEF